MESMEMSRQEEIENVGKVRPHIVILGAGGSVAALSNGDKRGMMSYSPKFEQVVKVEKP